MNKQRVYSTGGWKKYHDHQPLFSWGTSTCQETAWSVTQQRRTNQEGSWSVWEIISWHRKQANQERCPTGLIVCEQRRTSRMCDSWRLWAQQPQNDRVFNLGRSYEGCQQNFISSSQTLACLRNWMPESLWSESWKSKESTKAEVV